MQSSICIKHCYACWSLRFLPDSVLNDLAREMEQLRVNLEQASQALRAIITPEESYKACQSLSHDPRGETPNLLRQLRKKARGNRCCRGYWCLDYVTHFHEDGCFTIGGLHRFLLKWKARNAAQMLDSSRRKIENCFQRQRFFGSPEMLLKRIKRARRRDQPVIGRLLILADVSVGEEEVCLLRDFCTKLPNCVVVTVTWSVEEVNCRTVVAEVERAVAQEIIDVVIVQQNADFPPNNEEDTDYDYPGVNLLAEMSRCRALIAIEKINDRQTAVPENFVAHCLPRFSPLASYCLQEAILRYSFMAQHDLPFQEND